MGDEDVATISKAMLDREVDGWKLTKVLGNGANGLVFLVERYKETMGKKKEEKEIAVLKVALNLAASGGLEWESIIMERVVDTFNIEDRTAHLVRKMGSGKVSVDLKSGTEKLAYVIMENLPNNPVPIIGALTGEKQTMKICDFGLQLFRSLYDLHEVGFLHRDVKPENIGMCGDKCVVLYDMGMCRAFVDSRGNHRVARSQAGIRGTEEWCSLNAELGRDQGRVDDLWGWLYTLNEWANCRTQRPQAWSSYESQMIRQWMKSSFFLLRVVLNNCPFAFYRIALHLRTLGRAERPNYFFVSQLLKESDKRIKKKQKKQKITPTASMAELRFMENACF